ncbi:hypothetical protein OK074_5054 [Actinobacteria bacterium OK074]|nr:hypothetical protein OK074_5054 [Actinobacteria bacterium OK074]
MAELHRSLPSLNDRINWLSAHADPTEYEPVADSLYSLFNTARNMAPDRNATGCTRHPNGPVDTEAPENWGRCLLCNGNRRIGHPGVKAAPQTQQSMWAIPGPPYNRLALTNTMKRLNEAAVELELSSPDQDFERVAELTHAAFTIARELSRPRSWSGCPQHPGAPIDSDAPGGPQCMFCLGRQQRALRGEPKVNIRPSRPVPPAVRRPRTWPVRPAESA